MKKSHLRLQGVFLLLNLIAAIRYMDLGRWKAYVGLYGFVALALSAVAIFLFLRSIWKREFSVLLQYCCLTFCVMQFFPLPEAFIYAGFLPIHGLLRFHALYHIFTLIVGIVYFLLIKDKWRKIFLL